MTKKLFLIFLLIALFVLKSTEEALAVGCSVTNPTIVEHGYTPTTWQRYEGGNKYKTDVFVNTDVSSAVKIIYSIGNQSFPPLEFSSCSDGVNNARRTTVGGLPEGSTVHFFIKVYKTSDVNGTVTDEVDFYVVIPSGLVISNVIRPLVTYPDTYVVGGNKPSVAFSFNTNIDSIGSIEVTLPNNSVIGPAQYAPFKESALTVTPRIHTFTMGSLIPGTYTYVVNAFYNSSSTTLADSRSGNTFVIAPPATPEPIVPLPPSPTLTIIGTPAATVLSQNRVRFAWDTNVQTTSYVAYSDDAYSDFTDPDPANWASGKWRYNIDNTSPEAMKTHHEVEVGGLQAGTTYWFRVAGRDYPGTGTLVMQTGTGSFTTLQAIPTPTPTSTPVVCGTVVGGACCATSPKCTVNATTSTFLYCLSNACQSFNSIIIGASSWYNAFTSYYASFDFDNNDRVGGLDYVLWLKAGNHL